MTLVTICFTARDLVLLKRTFATRQVLRERYGCVNARLLTSADTTSAGATTRVLCLMEFPSPENARGYVAASRLQLDAEQHADLRTTSVEYFDSLIGSGDVDLREAGTG